MKKAHLFSSIALTTITPGEADKKIDALSLQWFLKFVSVNPDLFSWKRFGEASQKTAVLLAFLLLFKS
jgi:hypothetical protein